MRKLNKFILLCAVSLGLNAHAQNFLNSDLGNIKSIELFDGSQIDFQSEVATIQFADDRENKIDFIELKQGLIIDSYDVEKIILKKGATNLFDSKLFNLDRFGKGFKAARAGDGSGG